MDSIPHMNSMLRDLWLYIENILKTYLLSSKRYFLLNGICSS